MSAIAVMLLLALILYSPPPLQSEDWVAVPEGPESGSIDLLRREQIFLAYPSSFAQSRGLQGIRKHLDDIPQPVLETTVAAMIATVLDRAYMTVTVGREISTTAAVRQEAVSLIADIGGARAQEALRLVVRHDPDRDVRMYAIGRMGETSATDEAADMAVLSDVLYRAVRSVGGEREIRAAIEGMRRLNSSPAPQNRIILLESLRMVHEGPYSRSTREDAFSLLEELALR
jgi:hypothetical protein